MIKNRRYIIQFFFLMVALIYIVKLMHIQVIDDSYKLAAEDNVVTREVEYPYRGLIYDRNDKLIVINNPIYDLMLVPKEMKVSDTSTFCNLFEITEEEFIEKSKSARKYSMVKPSVFISKLSNEEFASLQDKLVDYPGFFVVARTVRRYPYNSFSNVLGYIGEIDKRRLNRDTTNLYRQGDYIGISGLESKYEEDLRGTRGVKYKMVNVRGIEKGSFKDHQYDTLSIPGENLVSTVDIELQRYGEFLLGNQVGSLVAIEPKTGEILSMVSTPSYDPNELSGRNFSKNYSRIQSDSLNPLFNRPIQADQYPPGSIFKMIQALIALEEGVITPNTRVVCDRRIIACHGPHSYEDLQGAIQHSCNPYFHQTFKRILNQGKSDSYNEDSAIGMENWRQHLLSFGLGRRLGVDIPNEKPGVIPTVELYDRIYGKGHWNFYTVYSLAIGQGELGVSPLQMANFASIIANRGYYIQPHLVKKVGEQAPHQYEKKYTRVSSEHYEIVVNAMETVVKSGTGIRANIPDLDVCGKTGTAENPHGEDHSAFIAFAPKEDPQIAIAVYVENAGQGGRAAAAIAGLMIEKYMKKEVQRTWMEDFVLKGDFIY